MGSRVKIPLGICLHDQMLQFWKQNFCCIPRFSLQPPKLPPLLPSPSPSDPPYAFCTPSSRANSLQQSLLVCTEGHFSEGSSPGYHFSSCLEWCLTRRADMLLTSLIWHLSFSKRKKSWFIPRWYWYSYIDIQGGPLVEGGCAAFRIYCYLKPAMAQVLRTKCTLMMARDEMPGNDGRPRISINDLLAFMFSHEFLEPRIVTLGIGIQGHRKMCTLGSNGIHIGKAAKPAIQGQKQLKCPICMALLRFIWKVMDNLS